MGSPDRDLHSQRFTVRSWEVSHRTRRDEPDLTHPSARKSPHFSSRNRVPSTSEHPSPRERKRCAPSAQRARTRLTERALRSRRRKFRATRPAVARARREPFERVDRVASEVADHAGLREDVERAARICANDACRGRRERERGDGPNGGGRRGGGDEQHVRRRRSRRCLVLRPQRADHHQPAGCTCTCSSSCSTGGTWHASRTKIFACGADWEALLKSPLSASDIVKLSPAAGFSPSTRQKHTVHAREIGIPGTPLCGAHGEICIRKTLARVSKPQKFSLRDLAHALAGRCAPWDHAWG